MLTVVHCHLYLLVEGVNQKLQSRRVEGSKGQRPDCSNISIHMQYCQAQEVDPDQPRQACKQPQHVSEHACSMRFPCYCFTYVCQHGDVR